MGIRFGLGFIFLLAVLLAASSLFFRSHKDNPLQERGATTLTQDDSTRRINKDSLSVERGTDGPDEVFDGDSSAISEVAEEPESNLEIVFLSLTQEMAKRGYSKGLSECIESQFRENLGTENPKDLDSMLKVCDSQFKVEAKQSQQIKDVVLQAIAKAQSNSEESNEKSTLE